MYNINSAGVEQSKAAYAQVLATIPDIEQSIRETENALSTLLRRSSPCHQTWCIGSTSTSNRTFRRYAYSIIIQPSGRESSRNVIGKLLLQYKFGTCCILSANHAQRLCGMDKQRRKLRLLIRVSCWLLPSVR